jgi:hypothetical protein
MEKHRYTIYKNREVFEKYRFEALKWIVLSENDKTAMIDHGSLGADRWPEIVFETDNLEDAKKKFEELKGTLDSFYAECQRELVLEEIMLEKTLVEDDDYVSSYDCIDYFLKDIPLSSYVDKLIEDMELDYESLDFEWVVQRVGFWFPDEVLPDGSSDNYSYAVKRLWLKHELDIYYRLDDDSIHSVIEHLDDVNGFKN